MSRVRNIAAFFIGILTTAAWAQDWRFFAGDAARSSTAAVAPRDFSRVRWTQPPLADEQFAVGGSPVTGAGRVFLAGRLFQDDVQTANELIAFDAGNGTRLWSTTLAIDLYSSISSPAVDVANRRVLLVASSNFYALNIADGSIAWQATLPGDVVDGSPLVTSGLASQNAPANRALISTYDPFGTAARLCAINVDPFDPLGNPFQPGDIAWTAPLGASGNGTPAYDAGRAYVATYAGDVICFDVTSGANVWTTNILAAGYGQYGTFFGGISVNSGRLFTGSYNFNGGENNSGLFKLDAASGAILWAVPSERTDSTPVVAGDGRVYLSGGIAGFGSAVKIQAFLDRGASASLTWDTSADTGGALIVGGYNFQPVLSSGLLYAGVPDTTQFLAPYLQAAILDLGLAPSHPGFVRTTFDGAGDTSAASFGRLFSAGTAGLVAFDASPACIADIDGDGVVTLTDLVDLLAAYGSASGDDQYKPRDDLDGSGVIDLLDLASLLSVYGQTCQ